MSKSITPNAIVHESGRGGDVLWQTQEDGLGEPAFMIADYLDDMIEINQEGRSVIINKAGIPALVRVLQGYYKHSQLEKD